MTVGFIKLHRKIIEWEWYSDVNTSRLFLHLLLTANFRDNKWRGRDVARGQLITSIASLAKSTTLSVRSVRTALTKLKSTNELTMKTTSDFSLITLTNYNLYQDSLPENDTPTDTLKDKLATNERQTKDKLATTTKEGKEGKEGKNVRYFPLTEGLILVLEAKLNKSFSNVKKSWSEEIRKLVEIDLKNRPSAEEDVKKVIQAIADNYGEEYFPVIQSANSLREKFSKLEAAVKRTASQKTQTTQELYSNLSYLDYLTGGKNAL